MFPRITYISDQALVPVSELVARVERARAPVCVLLRDKDASFAERQALAERFRKAARASSHGHALVVSLARDAALQDSLELACDAGAHGVHFPSALASRDAFSAARNALAARAGSQPRAWISAACHSPDEVVARAREGADVLFLSPIFQSPGKGAPLGVAALTAARDALDRASLSGRLIALGGVDSTNAAQCIAAGADGVAAIRADLSAFS